MPWISLVSFWNGYCCSPASREFIKGLALCGTGIITTGNCVYQRFGRRSPLLSRLEHACWCRHVGRHLVSHASAAERRFEGCVACVRLVCRGLPRVFTVDLATYLRARPAA